MSDTSLVVPSQVANLLTSEFLAKREAEMAILATGQPVGLDGVSSLTDKASAPGESPSGDTPSSSS